MKTTVITLLVLLCTFPIRAEVNDSTKPTVPDTIVVIHRDTVFSEELIETNQAEEMQEEILMGLLAEQGKQIAIEDSMAQAAADSTLRAKIAMEENLVDTLMVEPIDSATLARRIDSILLEKQLVRNEIKVDSSYIARYQAISQKAHPLLKELVFMPITLNMDWDLSSNFAKHYYKSPAQPLEKVHQIPRFEFWTDTITENLHIAARREITRNNADVYTTTFQKLPQTDTFMDYYIKKYKKDNMNVEVSAEIPKEVTKIDVEEIKIKKWIYEGNALAQFTQHYVSDNWYKGGTSNIAILGILAGSIKYDNKDNIQWENQGELRMGFNSVEGDTIRKISTNDDLFRIYSKLGIKAFGKFYYTASVEFKTQLFNTYKGVNSTELKTSIFSPIQLNANIGLDYKPFDGLSVMLAPLAYKFVFVNDTIKVPQGSFGIEEGKRTLNSVGSSLRVEYTWKPIEEISLVNKLYFYTDYEEIEFDWEVVCNFIINRFLTARIMVNPRFDTTAIAPGDEKAKLQFREMVSVGFSHKF